MFNTSTAFPGNTVSLYYQDMQQAFLADMNFLFITSQHGVCHAARF